MTNNILLASVPVCAAFMFLATGIVTGKWKRVMVRVEVSESQTHRLDDPKTFETTPS
jgi:hypothetical protein